MHSFFYNSSSERDIHSYKQIVREFQCLGESSESVVVSHKGNMEERFLVFWEEKKGIKVEIPTLGFPLCSEPLWGKWISCKS